MSIMIFGADVPVGSAIFNASRERGLISLARANDYYADADNIAREVRKDILEQRPKVVVNVTLDPDSGFSPEGSEYRLLSMGQTMLQQCRALGIRYILVSSRHVFGQQAQRAGGTGYQPYDPWLTTHADIYRSLLQSFEYGMLAQSSQYNRAAVRDTKPGFEAYCLRLGHVLTLPHYVDCGTSDVATLAQCFLKLIRNECHDFACGDPHVTLSPIHIDKAAEAVLELCSDRPRQPCGIYHVASTDSCSLSQLIHYFSRQAGESAKVWSLTTCPSQATKIYGVDGYQALDVSLWQTYSKVALQTWQQTVDAAIKTLRKQPPVGEAKTIV